MPRGVHLPVVDLVETRGRLQALAADCDRVGPDELEVLPEPEPEMGAVDRDHGLVLVGQSCEALVGSKRPGRDEGEMMRVRIA